MAGEIRRAVIRRLADTCRIPIGAAPHKYACMSIIRKQQLCESEVRRQQSKARS